MRQNHRTFTTAVAAALAISGGSKVYDWTPPKGGTGTPRHTPKMSKRPSIGWRNIQRKTRHAKLAKRVRANGRNK